MTLSDMTYRRARPTDAWLVISSHVVDIVIVLLEWTTDRLVDHCVVEEDPSMRSLEDGHEM